MSIYTNPFPVTERLCILGITGSGKSNTARVIVENMLTAGEFVVVIDPKGDWYGLRHLPDGSPSPVSVAVLGGRFGQTDLSPECGERLATVLAHQRTSAVLDLSEMKEGEARQFVAEFINALYRLNRAPMHVVIDEADEFAPQSGAAESQEALQRLQRRGRQRGFGTTFITQRSAVLNKGIIGQAGILIVHRTKHPRDLAPVSDFMLGCYGDASQVDDVPNLPVGAALVLSERSAPQRVQFRRSWSMDTMATPATGKTAFRWTNQAFSEARKAAENS